MAVPNRNHDDWIFPFSLIPRRWTSIPSDHPPTAIAHSRGLDKVDDIPNPGQWVLERSRYGLYFALTTRSLWHFRLGSFRWDAVDHYYSVPFTFTIKKLKSV